MSPVASLWTSWFLNSLNPIMGKTAVQYTSAFLYVLLSCVLVVIWHGRYLIKTKAWQILFNRKYVLSFLMIGTFSTALPFSLLMFSLNYTTPANAAILNQSELIYSLVFTYLMLGEKPTFKQLCAAGLIVLGVGIILFHDSFTLRWKGDLVVVGSVWMFQIGHIFAKKLTKNKLMTNRLLAASRALFALPALTLIVGGLMLHNGAPLPFKLSWPLVGVICYNGILNYGTGNIFWYNAIRNMDLSKATVVMMSYPCMTFIVSVLLGVETGHLYQVAGLALAFSGAFWMTGQLKKQAAKKEIAMAAATE